MNFIGIENDLLSGFCVYSKFECGDVENLLEMHHGKDYCVQQFGNCYK